MMHDGPVPPVVVVMHDSYSINLHKSASLSQQIMKYRQYDSCKKYEAKSHQNVGDPDCVY